ncbi:MAG TPA: FtsQ-type POTRA domain-containing protein [Blastocatellia bacterium]|nr:FtsQ-type POTRA domain-containing protein [Blastocatellia bacterium]
MRETRSNHQTAEPDFSGPISAGDLGLRRHRTANGVGVTPPRHKTGLPNEPARGQQRHSAKGANRPLSRPRETSGWLSRHRLKVFIALFALVLLVTVFSGMVWAYRSITGSQLFALHKIEVQGAVQTSPDELTQTLRQKAGGRSLWQVDLAALRTEVMKYPWIREAQLERVLPDTLRVTIDEREPFAPARRASGSLIWVDRDGVPLGERAVIKNGAIPPVISGLDEGDTPEVKEANKQRLNVYQQLLADLDREEPKLSDKVDEITLEDIHDVRLRLVEKNISVMLGDTNFRARLASALKILDAVERKDVAALGLLNASDAERIIKGERVAYLRATRDDRVHLKFAQ